MVSSFSDRTRELQGAVCVVVEHAGGGYPACHGGEGRVCSIVKIGDQARMEDLATIFEMGWRHSSFGGPGSVVWTMAYWMGVRQ
jgi:hypothetical protein